MTNTAILVRSMHFQKSISAMPVNQENQYTHEMSLLHVIQ